MNKRMKGLMYLMLSTVFFGTMPLLVNLVCAGGGNVASVTFYRFFLVLFPLAVYLKIKKVPMRITREEGIKIIILGVFGYGITGILLFASYLYMPTGVAMVIHFGYPVFVFLGSVLFLKKKISRIKAICVVLCVGGIALSYVGGDGQIEFIGVFLAVLSGITYAFYILYLESSGIQRIPAFKMIFYLNIIASVMTLAGSAVTGKITLSLSGNAWLAMVILSLGATFIGVGLFQKGVQLVGAQDAAILSTFEPVTSMIVGILVLHERAALQSLIGCVLVLVSVVVTATRKE